MRNTLVAIPARMQSTRLPGKPLADIHGEPMIVHVWNRAIAAGVGRVIVATDSQDVISAVRAAGGEAILTRADHPSGSDRIFEALNKIDPDGEIENIVNLQGDLPSLEPHLVNACLKPLQTKAVQIATLAAEIKIKSERTNPNVVKVIGTAVDLTTGQPLTKTSTMSPTRLRALYFTRATAPSGDGPLFHHIGIYAYRRSALERFVGLRPSPLELRERLEQLRAIEDGMRIDVAVVDTVPLGVDTPEDLEKAKKLISST
ncbi:MAG: 3-deoxy-manno-octulosonate cytidylyltransferase [Hyphomicrobiaceae bacterium]|nr:3-deoxy-manno-octulosonate cytidylyltransferase [Hyphomicrobiaceae bacterium]